MTHEDYQRILDGCGGKHEVLPQRVRWLLLQNWREVYAAGLHDATGHWKHDGFEWHVFSFKYARALNGAKAVAAYESQRVTAVVVCPESRRLPAVRLEGSKLPSFRSEREDVYVWPDDLAWTLAFTHEESIGLGPYFCRQEWVSSGLGRGREKREETPRSHRSKKKPGQKPGSPNRQTS